MHDAGDLVRLDGTPKPLRGKNVAVTIDLEGSADSTLIGYRAKKHTDRIDVDKIASTTPPISGSRSTVTGAPRLILDPDEFYILATRRGSARAAGFRGRDDPL